MAQTFTDALKSVAEEIGASMGAHTATVPDAVLRDYTASQAPRRTAPATGIAIEDETRMIHGTRVRVVSRSLEPETGDVLLSGRYAGSITRTTDGYRAHRPSLENKYVPTPSYSAFATLGGALDHLLTEIGELS